MRVDGTMELELRGQPAVVVGAARGIGRAIAEAFAREGAPVALLDRDALVEQTAQEVQAATGCTCLSVQIDIVDFAAMQAAAERVTAVLGPHRHIAHVAAIGSDKFGFPFWNLCPADWPRVLNVNILGAVHTAHAFCPGLVAQRQGTLTFISSVAGQIGSQTDPPYSASKAALINFAQCAAKDLAPHGVRVNTICPGMIQTDLNRAVWRAWHDQQPPEARRSYEDWTAEKISRVMPLGRWQTPTEIAEMAVFLASARAASVLGQTINVDGGFVMHW